MTVTNKRQKVNKFWHTSASNTLVRLCYNTNHFSLSQLIGSSPNSIKLYKVIASTLHNTKPQVGSWRRSSTSGEGSDREPRWQGNWLSNIHERNRNTTCLLNLQLNTAAFSWKTCSRFKSCSLLLTCVYCPTSPLPFQKLVPTSLPYAYSCSHCPNRRAHDLIGNAYQHQLFHLKMPKSSLFILLTRKCWGQTVIFDFYSLHSKKI